MVTATANYSYHHMQTTLNLADPIIIGFSALVKAAISPTGQRQIELEVSNENRDSEGDVILQSALLNSADSYLRSGHIDIDHYSELGRNPAYSFLRIQNPDEWIIGKPLEVKDMGGGRTGIKAEIFKSPTGEMNPQKYKYDEFWASMQTQPPAQWYASVYGFPGPDTVKGGGEATRYLVKSFEWRSTAVTRTPINGTIKSSARIVTVKSFAAHLPRPFPADEKVWTREQIRQCYHNHLSKSCPSTGNGQDISIWTIRDHYMNCDFLTYNLADTYALASSELIRRENGNKS